MRAAPVHVGMLGAPHFLVIRQRAMLLAGGVEWLFWPVTSSIPPCPGCVECPCHADCLIPLIGSHRTTSPLLYLSKPTPRQVRTLIYLIIMALTPYNI